MSEGINVLSLFDGMSCGQIALERAGIKVKNYFASEIDKYAIQVARKNYPNMIHLGDVTKIRGDWLPKIDLIIAGSPCQGFSFAGKQLNFDDPRSKLFFEFTRLLDECRPQNFLLENVVMQGKYQNVISDHTGVKPVLINSNLVSAQNRKRLYWASTKNIPQPKDKITILSDVLEDGSAPFCYSTSGRGRKGVEARLSHDNKAHTLTTCGYSNRSFSGAYKLNDNNRWAGINEDKRGWRPFKKDKSGISELGRILKREAEYTNTLTCSHAPKLALNSDSCDLLYRKLTPIECERLQTVPDNYTDGASATQRYKMLGNGWTVDVIAHIFKHMDFT